MREIVARLRKCYEVLRQSGPHFRKQLDLPTSSPARDQLLTAQPCPPRPIATPPASDSASDSSSTGIAIRSTVPLPFDSRCKLPPSSRTRSRIPVSPTPIAAPV